MLVKGTHDDEGFTLIELLIAIMISGVILGALVTGFIVTMRGTKGTHERLVESHDAQLLAVYLPSDAQSADPALVALDVGAVTATTTPTGCGAGVLPPAGSTNRLRLQWTELASDSTLTGFSVSYRLEAVSAAEARLVRYYCSGTTLVTSPLPLSTADRKALLQTALIGAAATTTVVGHDLSTSQDIPTIDGRLISWSLATSLKPPIVEPAQYAFRLSTSMRKQGSAAAPPPPGSYVVNVPASVTAGSSFNVTVKLSGFTGTKNLTWSVPGGGAAPNGTGAPLYPASPAVNFIGGVSSPVPITLVKAETTTLGATDGTSTGVSVNFTVNAGPASNLIYTDCSVNLTATPCAANLAVGANSKFMDAFVSVRDTYGNVPTVTAGTSWIVTVTSSDPTHFAVSGAPVSIAGPATRSTAPAFRVTHTDGSSTGPATLTITSVPLLTAASMTVTKS